MNTTKSTNRTLRQRLLSRRGLAALAAVLGLAVATVAAVLVAGSESRSAEDSATSEESGELDDETATAGDTSTDGPGGRGEAAVDGGPGPSGSAATARGPDGSAEGGEGAAPGAGAASGPEADAAWNPEGRVPIDDPGIDFNDDPGIRARAPGWEVERFYGPLQVWENAPACANRNRTFFVRGIFRPIPPSGVASAHVTYSINGGPQAVVAMAPVRADMYGTTFGPFPFGTVPLAGGEFRFTITARDGFGNVQTDSGSIRIHSGVSCLS